MRQYELVFIIRPDLEEEAVEAVIEKVKALAENNGAEVTKLDKWGKRRLAYEIKHVREGYYVVMNFKGEAAVAAELDRVLKITDEILRHIIVRDDDN
ncbi:30S ribosomal protein S6 [Desulfallas sp. Bu1-1]|uniref:30S ribosomal protein S6 n=1 Tax=Desulfallas sp. Bu1-1 TaxID=2787620 RepID=UPI00189F8A33|nr:30S ribosomal protein S6 [Desulfallas sp. Bu1-1]MBF7081390.1 30S ribosomal protein S6 [Desulfallas sp. Bu1-1]